MVVSGSALLNSEHTTSYYCFFISLNDREGGFKNVRVAKDPHPGGGGRGANPAVTLLCLSNFRYIEPA